MFVSDYPSFCDRFKLPFPGRIKAYFVQGQKSFAKGLAVKVARVAHYAHTGAWIDTSKICDWAQEHPDQEISKLLRGTRVFKKVKRFEENRGVKRPSYFAGVVHSLRFFSRYLVCPTTVGAVLPSSRSLAKAMIKDVERESDRPRRFLEAGPGQGVFTDEIIAKLLRPQDELCLVEFDETFAGQLREKYAKLSNVVVLHQSILDHTSEQGYDAVFSGLPCNSFPHEMVDEIFTLFTQITKPGGQISYFDYIALPHIKKRYLNAQELENFEAILQTKRDFFREHGSGKKEVWSNVPPARVHYHRL